MDIVLHKLSLHFLDVSKNEIESVALDADKHNIQEYVGDLIEEILDSPNKRKYTFKPGNTQVKSSIQDIIEEIETVDEVLLNNAKRLLEKEIVAEAKVKRMGRKVQRGSLLHIYFSQNGNDRVLICKVDHDEILNEITFEKDRGLNTKKKIFKSFLIYMGTDDKNEEIYLNDKNNSVYWWSEFLELEQVNTNERNTEQAVEKITSLIDTYKKKKREFLLDGIIIRNNAIGYFRTNKNFNFSEFMEKVFEDYSPYNENFPINKLRDSISGLIKNEKFDSQFKIAPNKINKRIITELKLSSGIFLRISDFVQNLEEKLIPFEGIEGVGMTILSDEAYNIVKYKNYGGQ
ncbi:MAG: nucleoid-associated protein [Gelidibacter sp.]